MQPSRDPSRFVVQIYTHRGEPRTYTAVPSHSPSADTALLDAWLSFGVPAPVWSLFPRDAVTTFAEPEHEAAYVKARWELCRALYVARASAWARQLYDVRLDFAPPEGGYVVPDAFAETAENEELVQSAMARRPPRSSPTK